MLRWRYWALFDVEIMSPEQEITAKHRIKPAVVMVLEAWLVVLAVVYVVFGEARWYLIAGIFVWVVALVGYSYYAKVPTLLTLNPSRFLPEPPKWLRRLKHWSFVIEMVVCANALKVPTVGWRLVYLLGFSGLAFAWSWWQWQRLNRLLRYHAA